MPSRFMTRTIVIYQIMALMGWSMMARRTEDGLQWIQQNLHGVIYITLATTMLFVTFVYIIQWSLDRLGITTKLKSMKDPRKTDK